MKIAIDAMGGDNGHQVNVAGACLAINEFPILEKLYLVGDKDQIIQSLDSQKTDTKKIEIVHSSEVIEMNESPAMAIRRKKKSSISIATDLVKEGTCQAIVSAGNTGAAVAAATLKLRNLKGIERAGIASPMPNEFGTCYLVDAGANTEAKPSHLVQYAIVGSVYSKEVNGK